MCNYLPTCPNSVGTDRAAARLTGTPRPVTAAVAS